eukprot:jgi/Antlo1/1367/1210
MAVLTSLYLATTLHMNCEKIKEYLDEDVQDDSIYLDTNLNSIYITTITDEAIVNAQPRSPEDRVLERILHPCYANVVCANPKLTLLHEETLFYIFYMYPGDRMQESAFFMLLDLGYFFCTTLKCFVSFTEKHIAEQLTSGRSILDNKKHKIVIFDPFCWEKLTKEVVYDSDFVNSLKYA